MKEIKLTRGEVALVDDEDYEYLNQWKWYADKKSNTFYAARQPSRKLNNGKRKAIYMHRFIMNINNPKIMVDHKDHNGLNNCRSNIIIAFQK